MCGPGDFVAGGLMIFPSGGSGIDKSNHTATALKQQQQQQQQQRGRVYSGDSMLEGSQM
eukprot:CAMPEP_0170377884 /NCGR_PEP_ID=MMETSP0117_2-20130122/12513_1 /TAXON_ID=400756 /ORGANISM="Durinskia baltica, Strain CSIRO CS-38" /LENGTH=58 /DNA_ID=CAMNT_0010633217 /DNA_START=297 /DNA_END=474 /DNA_ORIENTATION=+